MEAIEIRPRGPVSATVRPPGSKSITNRALVCAALAQGASRLTGALDSEDTRVMIAALRALGIPIDVADGGGTLTVLGCAGRPPRREAELFVANSGTTMRFLSALLAAVGGSYRLDGVARMRERPIGDLLAALRQLGADAHGEQQAHLPPVLVRSQGLAGGTAQVAGDISSQFLSGLLLAAPYARGTVTLSVVGPLVSQPYVTMTIQVMEAFGVATAARPESEPGAARAYVVRAPQCYRGRDYDIEPDASAASYFWAAAAITQGRILVEGLSFAALQGDVAFCDCLRRMGCAVEADRRGIAVRGGPLVGIDVDMNPISDTVQTLAAVALFARGPTTIRGVAHIRHKETDRIGDLARELRKLGAGVTELTDGLRIEPRPLQPAGIDTYNDHRMAMSLALVGLRQPGVVIRNPQCVAKTYPAYFRDLDQLGTGPVG